MSIVPLPDSEVYGDEAGGHHSNAGIYVPTSKKSNVKSLANTERKSDMNSSSSQMIVKSVSMDTQSTHGAGQSTADGRFDSVDL
jgi:hypothetical protein